MIDNLSNKMGNIYRGVVNKITAPPTVSTFKETGQLTPAEFLSAGDQLVKACPAWQWRPAVSDKFATPYLPLEKQYLVTDAISNKRVADVLNTPANEKEIEGDWIINERINEDVGTIFENTNSITQMKFNHFSEEEEKKIDRVEKEEKDEKLEVEKEKEIVKAIEPDSIRFYKLSISYDLYFLTPRMWITAVSEKGLPLKTEEIYEDIMSEYANKTVTVETHPHLNEMQPSVHPCKHSNVIKTLIDMAKDNGIEIEPHQCLFLFLKFMSAVVPTIEYDFAMEVNLG